MSDTPRTDSKVEELWHSVNVPTNPVPADFARQLERELADSKADAKALASALHDMTSTLGEALEKLAALRRLVTTEHESKEAFIARVNAILNQEHP